MNMQDPAAGYASWISPAGSGKVVYPLGLFHEIDTLVNDGYRRIPHGGIETGGLLFGVKNGNALQIEAFRLIQCRHAFGPSFLLSEEDLQDLREQLASSESDDELRGLGAVGWFVGHTRSALQMSDREAAWFDEFFPDEGSVTVLVRPERFQPTRFGFLLRDGNGRIERDASQTAVILPLSAQTAAPSRKPYPSIPASSKVEAELEAPAPRLEPVLPAPEPVLPAPEPVLPAPEPVLPAPQPPPQPASGRITRVRAPQPPRPAGFSEIADSRNSELAFPYASLPQERKRVERRKSATFGWKSAAILVLAAVLGCIVGYWAYLQLPSPVIPVSIREQRGQLIVEWPSAQTQNVDYAALQINDGQWIALSSLEKTAGHAVVTAPSGDLKIDLLAKHWLRDSRGIVRYIRTPRTVPQVPAATNQR